MNKCCDHRIRQFAQLALAYWDNDEMETLERVLRVMAAPEGDQRTIDKLGPKTSQKVEGT